MSVPSRVKRYIKQYLENNATSDNVEFASINNKISASKKGGVQAAIDAASENDVVLVDKQFQEWGVNPKSGVDIVGTHRGGLIYPEDGSGGRAIDIQGSLSDVEIRGLVIDGKWNNNTDSTYGIVSFGNDVSDVDIVGNHFKNLHQNAVEIKGNSTAVTMERIHIRNNTFQNIRRHCAFMGTAGGSSTMKECSMDGNTCINFAQTGSIGLTFKGDSSTNLPQQVSIDNNTFFCDTGSASYSIAYEAGVERATINGNIIRGDGSTPNGIVVNGPSDSVTIGNNELNDAKSGIRVDGSSDKVAVCGNQVKGTDSGAPGVGVNSSNYVAIVGNNLYDLSGAGINGGYIASGNVVVEAGQNGTKPGIVGCDCSTGNYVEGAGAAGIRLDEGDQTATGNVCVDNGSDVLSTLGPGIHTISTGNLVVGNRCYDSGTGNQAYGISGRNSNGDDNVVVGNNVQGNATAGINSAEVGANSTLYGNLPAYYDLDEVITGVAGGATVTSSAISRASLGDDVDVSVQPNADPNNDIAFDSRVLWDDSAGSLVVEVVETANAGGGDVRVTAKKR